MPRLRYGEDCGPAFTGGHYDPTFGCGPASDNQPEECAKVGRGKDDGEAQTCDVMADVSTCELGDLSGKTRKVRTGAVARRRGAFEILRSVEISATPRPSARQVAATPRSRRG